MKIGLDIGNTIVSSTGGERIIFPYAFEVIRELTKSNEVYLISRVNSEQRERSLKWLADTNFFNATGVAPNNLFYCFERRDKAIFVKALGIDVMVDDRPSVMSEMDDRVFKILFRPLKKDVLDLKKPLFNSVIVEEWNDISKLLLHKNIVFA